LRREEPLAKSGDIPQERLEKTRSEAVRTEAARRAAENAVTTARAEIEQARAEVAAARTALLEPSVGQQRGAGGELVTVRWPVSGRVLKLVKESEGVVGPGEALIELGNTRALEVEVEVLSVDAVKMAPGTEVELVRWGGEKPLVGRVRVVEPSGFTKISALGVEEQRVNVICDLVSPIETRPTLGDAYRVEARIVVWENPDVLLVPAGALYRREGAWRTFVVEGNRARERTLTVGRSNGVFTEITEGLRADERVVVYPGDKVVEGRRVRGLEVSSR